jgi:hypothetical protein
MSKFRCLLRLIYKSAKIERKSKEAFTMNPFIHDRRDEADPLIRMIYGIGVVLIAFGAFLPGGTKWALAGAAIATVCCILEG